MSVMERVEVLVLPQVSDKVLNLIQDVDSRAQGRRCQGMVRRRASRHLAAVDRGSIPRGQEVSRDPPRGA
jgi:hypothetical protein